MARTPPTIIVAGAGTIGLAVGAALASGRASDRLRIQVLDARPLPRWRADEMDLRVYALSRASQQLFAELGAWSALAAARVSPYRRMHVWEGADPFAPGAITFDSADIGEPDLGHIVEDSLLRSTLADVLAASPNVEIASGATLTEVDIGARTVSVQLDNGGRYEGAVLVAADGGDSAVRRTLDLPVVGHSYAQVAVVAHVTSSQPHRQTAWQRFLPGGPLAFLPLADGRSSIVWSLPTDEGERLLAASPAEFLAELQVASADVLGRLDDCTARAGFPLQATHAIRYCTARAALVGDAAHTVHPLAGQGMNLGLLDAACLAAVIEDAVLAGEDPGDLKVLRRYERSRKGDNIAMLAVLDGLHRLYQLPSWVAPLRRFGMGAVDATGPAKRLLMRRALGLSHGNRTRLPWSHAESQA